MKQVVHLQKDYQVIKKLGAEVLVVFREDKKEVEGLKISADKSGAEFSLLTDLGRKATPRYEGLGQTFKTYIIGPDGKVKKILTGNKLVRPNAKSVVEALKNTGQ